jgi:hypothetical protein
MNKKSGTKQSAPAGKRHMGRLGYKWRILVALIVILIAARLYLPVWVLHYVNRKINETPGYSGYIEDVDIHLWRGAYVIRNTTIYKSTGKVPVPFFSAPAIDLSVQWRELFHGAFVGNIEFQKPEVHFVKGPTESQTQVGVDKPWISQIKQLFPLKINRFHVDDGEVHYHDFFSKPPVHLKLEEVYMTATNLTNSRKLSKSEIATLHAEAKPVGEGTLKTDVTFDPYQADPTFNLKAEIANVPLVKLSELTRAYAYFDFKAGNFSAATEMKASGGEFHGYFKPVFDHMQIFSLQQDIKNPVKLVWEGFLETIGRVLRNQPKDRFATEVPLSGSFKDPKGAVLPTIGNVFKNAFIQVFNAKVEGGIDVHDVREKQVPTD